MVCLQPIILFCDFSIILLRDTARLRHLESVPRDLGLFFFADTIPVARDMLIAKQRAYLLQSPSLGLLYESQCLRLANSPCRDAHREKKPDCCDITH